MKILAITAYYPPYQQGGYELRCKDVLDGLRQKGHEICLITNQVPDNQVSNEVDASWVHRILSLKSEGDNVFFRIRSDNYELKKIERVLRTHKPDLLFLWHLQNLSDAILPYLALQKLPIVYDEGGSGLIYYVRLQKRGLYFYKNEQDGAVKRWLKQAIKAYARLVSKGKIVTDWEWPTQMRVYFNSQSGLKHAQEMGAPVEDAEVIPSGIDVSKFPFKSRKKIKTPVRIVVPTRVKEQKGCKDVILLVDELRRCNIPAQVLIIGEVQSAAYLDELLSLKKDLGLNDSVEIRPMVSQAKLGEIYRDADICFFPSYFKTGFSRVPLEAMASGCLLLTYGNEGCAELVRHEETGLIIANGDIRAAAGWIDGMIKDPTIFQNLTQAARGCIETNFKLENYVDSIEAFLQNSLPN